MLKFIKSILPYQPWSWMDYVIMGLVGIVILFLGFLLFMFISWICKLIFYSFAYDPALDHKGKVKDMRYRASYVTTQMVGKTMTTTYHPAQNWVRFETEVADTEIDSESLYQRVRIGESVTVRSQKIFIKPRFWDGEWKYDGDRLISVTSEKDLQVDFNDEKPSINRGKYDNW